MKRARTAELPACKTTPQPKYPPAEVEAECHLYQNNVRLSEISPGHSQLREKNGCERKTAAKTAKTAAKTHRAWDPDAVGRRQSYLLRGNTGHKTSPKTVE